MRHRQGFKRGDKVSVIIGVGTLRPGMRAVIVGINASLTSASVAGHTCSLGCTGEYFGATLAFTENEKPHYVVTCYRNLVRLED